MAEANKQAKPAKQPAANKPRKAQAAKSGARVRITLVGSVIGTRASHRATVRGLGLKRRHHTVELEDTPAVRGMIEKVSHLVRIVDEKA